MREDMLISAAALAAEVPPVIVDCRFSLADPAEGRRLYAAGHLPGAYYLDLNRDLSGPPGTHGGRHPLPDAAALQLTLARCGIGPETEVVAYDASRFAFAARLWWLMRSLGYRPPRLLDGGFQAWEAMGGPLQTDPPPARSADWAPTAFSAYCDIDAVRDRQAAGATLVDSREAVRYAGLEEPIDPVAGHIPGAINHPWQAVTDDNGFVRDEQALRRLWGASLEADDLVVYCGSGVTACVNLFALALLGRDDACLYPGSWSDWCSYLS